MTPVNMAKHRNNPNMAFWKMIKEGNDHFEVTRQEPKVDFCEKKYVFNAAKPADAKRDPVFDASAKCPAYVIPQEIASAVREKQEKDEAEYAKLLAKGTPVARMNTGIDGGMNKVFAAKIPEGSTGLSESAEGSTLQMLAMSKAPGTIPDTVNPPKPNLSVAATTQPEEPVVAVPAQASNTRVAAAAPAEKSEGRGFFSNLARKMGMGTADTTATASPTTATPNAPAKPKTAEAKPAPHPEAPKSVVAVKPAEPKPAEPKVAASRPPLKPSVSDSAAETGSKDTQLAGAAPVVQSNSFDSRFGAIK
jgi:hypothetical protein